MNKNLFRKQPVDLKGQVWCPSVWIDAPVEGKMKSNVFRNWGKRAVVPSNTKGADMCDISGIDKLLVLLVKKQIATFVKARVIFSAWDITKLMRENVWIDYNISHSSVRRTSADVREVIKDWFEGTTNKGGEDWSRTLIDLKNGKTTYVYHPLTILAEGYPGFDQLAPTSDFGSGIKSAYCCNDNDKAEAFKKLFEGADAFGDVVSEFIDGNNTLADLTDAYDDFVDVMVVAEKV